MLLQPFDMDVIVSFGKSEGGVIVLFNLPSSAKPDFGP
jgi:hypothetical protein